MLQILQPLPPPEYWDKGNSLLHITIPTYMSGYIKSSKIAENYLLREADVCMKTGVQKWFVFRVITQLNVFKVGTVWNKTPNAKWILTVKINSCTVIVSPLNVQ